jgi:hypothetical protein
LSRKLTPEYADRTDLPLNPFIRFKQVAAILSDEIFIGEGVHILTDEMAVVDQRTGFHIPIYRAEHKPLIKGFLGRNVLKNVANIIDYIDNSVVDTGGNYT